MDTDWYKDDALDRRYRMMGMDQHTVTIMDEGVPGMRKVNRILWDRDVQEGTLRKEGPRIPVLDD